jgi:hypothetical protein
LDKEETKTTPQTTKDSKKRTGAGLSFYAISARENETTRRRHGSDIGSGRTWKQRQKAEDCPIDKNDSLSVFRLSDDKLSSRIFSELRGRTSTLRSWLRITTPRAEALSAILARVEYVEPFVGVDDISAHRRASIDDPDRIDLLLGFAYRVRQGDDGDGAQVRAGSVQ